VREAIGRLRHADATVLNFVYRDYDGAVHGTRVDEALAAHLTSTSDRPVSRDAARRRLTDSRVRLEDTIVGAHRHHLLHLTTVHGARLGVGDRTALVAYLSMVGKRPRNVVIEAAYATATASTDPDRLPWSDRKSFVTTLCAEVRALFRLHMDLLRSDGIGSSGDRRSASDEAPR
jgi:hypothetical protein